MSTASSADTQATVLAYHIAWKGRDLDAILALYHPDVQYNDFFQNRCLGISELRDYVSETLPRQPEDYLEHTDRIRIDGDTAFIQYQLALAGAGHPLVFRSSEAITVRDGLIWRINEYASLVRAPESASASQRTPAISKLGLSARQLSHMARDLKDYFERQRPFLDPELSLQAVAHATGYSRNQISYLLNQVLGQSFYRYVNQARLAHLLDQMTELGDTVPIDELAARAGFNSTSAFYKVFRAGVGTSPKAWLRAHCTRTRR